MAVQQINSGDPPGDPSVESTAFPEPVTARLEQPDGPGNPSKQPSAFLDQMGGLDLGLAARAWRMLSACNRALVESQEETALLRATVRALVNPGGYRLAWVGVAGDLPEKKVRVLAQAGGDSHDLMGAGMAWAEAMEIDCGPTGIAFRTGQLAVDHDLRNDSRVLSARRGGEWRGSAASLALPLICAGQMFGVLTIHSGETAAFQREESELLVQLADLLAYGWNNLRLREENQRAGLARRNLEERLRAVLQTTSDGFWRVDREGRIVEVNQAYCLMSGYSSRELTGMRVAELEAGGEDAALVSHRAGIMAHRYGRFESRHRPRDGRVFAVEITARPAVEAEQPLVCFLRDLTARQQGEQALRESESRRGLAERLAGLAAWEWDLERNQYRWSDQLFGLLELLPTAGSPSPGFFLDFVHPSDREAVQAAYPQSVANRTPYQIEYRLWLGEGREKHVRERGETFYSSSGRPLRSWGSLQEISEQKRAQAAHRLQQDLYAALLELPRAAEGLAEPAFIQVVLAKARAITGSAVGYLELIPDQAGAPDAIYFSPESHAAATPAAQRLIPGTAAIRLRRAVIDNDCARGAGGAGLRRYVTLPLFQQDRVVLLLGVGDKPGDYSPADVDALQLLACLVGQVLLNRRLADARNQLVTALELTSESVSITDPTGRFLYVNPAFEKSSGYSRFEALGALARILKSGRQDEEFYRGMWQSLSRGEVWAGRFHNRRKDGSFFEEEATISPVRDARGAIASYVAIKRDVAPAMPPEAPVRPARVLEAMATLAGGMAHEFNNILTIILGFGSALQQEFRGDAAAREDLDTILQAAERARDLVRQMLSFARREEQKCALVQLGEAVNDALESLRDVLPAGINVDWRMDPATPLVLADPDRIYQATLNLATNSLQAMEGSRGSLTVRLEPFHPDARFLREHPEFSPADYARLSVADTGRGMDTQTLEHIYEPFFTTKSMGKGSGLGLSVVHGIVASHQGFITVASEPGVGTTFCLYFPVSKSGPNPDRNAPRGDLPAGAGEKVLVVDDEVAITILTQRLLKRLNYEVTICNQSDAALALVQADPARFDLVITDLAMPNLTGLELVAEIRALRPDLPAILATGLPPHLSPDELLRAGISEVLMKPVSPQTMAEALRRALSGPAAPAID